MALKNDEEAISKYQLRQQLMRAASEMVMKKFSKKKSSGVYKIKHDYEQSKKEFISYSQIVDKEVMLAFRKVDQVNASEL